MSELDPDVWLAACRAAADAAQTRLGGLVQRSERERVIGRGEGGDETVAVDQVAEEEVLAAFERLHQQDHSFTVISEELGERRYGDGDVRVVVDPIDGSANAKRGIPFYSLSIAVAAGPTMGDVKFGYVKDFGSGEEWTATRGGGAFLNGTRLSEEKPKEELEVLSLEATRMSLVAEHAPVLSPLAERLRIMGSCALSLCHFAAGRVDAVCTLRPIRSVDIATTQLLATEQELPIRLTDGRPIASAPLDLTYRSRVVAAARADTCDHLSRTLRRVVPDERASSYALR
ncbi:MAG: inositol monophosphatase family protein [Gaiellaceae bacterium]